MSYEETLSFKNISQRKKESLEENHCVESVRIGSYSGPYFPTVGVSLRIQSKCGKIRTKITPTTDTF